MSVWHGNIESNDYNCRNKFQVLLIENNLNPISFGHCGRHRRHRAKSNRTKFSSAMTVMPMLMVPLRIVSGMFYIVTKCFESFESFVTM